MSDQENELSVFRFDFILSSIFGYKCVNVRSEEGTFEVFEPSLKTNVISRMETYAFKKKVQTDSESESESSSESSMFVAESSDEYSSNKKLRAFNSGKGIDHSHISRTVTTANDLQSANYACDSPLHQQHHLKHTLTSNKTLKR